MKKVSLLLIVAMLLSAIFAAIPASAAEAEKAAIDFTKLDYVNCYKPVNIKNLYSSLLEQAKKSGVYGVHFVDEAAPPKMLEDFASLNKDKALTFWGNIRFEKAFSRDLADILAKGGLIGVSGGIEMACGEGLSNINKGIDIKHCYKAFCSKGI